jgi:type VI secretion system protein ImpK
MNTMTRSTDRAGAEVSRPQNLALYFQDVITVIVRLRTNRQPVSDPESFRDHVREALRSASQQALERPGYSADDVRMATFAMVAFLDESILNSRNPLFADWPRKPLQEELFGTHVAGEVFFQNLQKLLSGSDSAALGDLLEIYYLCMLLGFAGRFSGGSRHELNAPMNMTREKIRRIRGQAGDLSPAWSLPVETTTQAKDPWVRRFAWAAAAILALALLLFIGYKVSLASGVSGMRATAFVRHNRGPMQWYI